MGFISSMGYSSFIKKNIKYWQYRIYSENVNPPLVIAQPKGDYYFKSIFAIIWMTSIQ